MKKMFALNIIATLVFISCSKEKVEPVSKTQLLTASPWYLTRFTTHTGGVTSEIPYPACSMDDPYEFNSDGRLTQTQGVSKCNPADLDYTIEGSWELKENGTILGLKWGSASVLDYQILKLTKDSLVHSIADYSTIYTFYFAHTF